MADDPLRHEPNFLRRWAQRKLAAARETQAPTAPVAVAPVPPAPAAAEPLPANAPTPPASEPAAPLPDVASLTFDSDFKAFLAPEVDEGTRRAALRKLFSDPRFNVQDGLDVYIDDYSKFEPIPEDVLGKLAHARYLFDPPKTRVNAQGHVEDVVEAPEASAGGGDALPPEAAPPSNTPVATEIEPTADAMPRASADDAEGAAPVPAASQAPS